MQIPYTSKKNINLLCAIITFFSHMGTTQAEISISPEFGYQSGKLSWNIAGNSNGCCPNILSELTWSDLEIYRTGITLTSVEDNHWLTRYRLGYGVVNDGQNQDSDYIGDNRTLEYSRSRSDVSGDEVIDLVFALGYQFKRLNENAGKHTMITPMVGYAYHEQNFRVVNGVQSLPATGPFTDLNTTYNAQWRGLWTGVDLELQVSEDEGFLFGYEYHRPDYYGEANWNLRTDFQHPKSFEHIADGSGSVLRFMYWFNRGTNTRWQIGVEDHHWETSGGVDRIFFSNGTIAETHLNEVVFDSMIIKLTVTISL